MMEMLDVLHFVCLGNIVQKSLIAHVDVNGIRY